MAYATYLEVQEATPDVEWGPDHNQLLLNDITKAAELIDRLTRRYDVNQAAYEAATSASTRVFSPRSRLRLAIDECVEVTLVRCRFGSGIDWTSLASTDWASWPYNSTPIIRLEIDERQGSHSAWPSTGPRSVEVTGKWGYSTTVPGVVKKATIIQVARWWRQGAQMFADRSIVSDLGSPRFSRNLDPDIRTLIIESGLMQKHRMF